MDKPSFRDALIISELKDLEKHPQKISHYALTALLRMQNYCEDDIQINLIEDSPKIKATIGPSPSSRNADEEIINKKNAEVSYLCRCLFGKYPWLSVQPNYKQPDFPVLVIKRGELFRYFEEGSKKSDLLEAKLKHSLWVLGNTYNLTTIFNIFRNSNDRINAMKVVLWENAMGNYLTGASLDSDCCGRYTIGGVFKAMAREANEVLTAMHLILKDQKNNLDDVNTTDPQILAYKKVYVDVAKARIGRDDSEIAHLFQLVEDIGKTAQALDHEKRKEAGIERR
ncbi:MAG: hypothetical protein KGI29_03925 [Pseudomonadota bacterium]|nr:hypothetical protein [Pseudomonadota bacterium]